MRDTVRVQFIHGLEGHPQGTKALFLAERFEARTPSMNTSDLEGSIETQALALQSFRPDVLVGSSFGGAVAVALLSRGLWRGATVLLCPAAELIGVEPTLPPGVAVTVVQGVDDDIVPMAHSEALAATGTPELVRLVRVRDGHRLQTIVDDGSLAALVSETLRRHAGTR